MATRLWQLGWEGALKLPQRVQAEPDRQTVSGAFKTKKNASCDYNNGKGIASIASPPDRVFD